MQPYRHRKLVALCSAIAVAIAYGSTSHCKRRHVEVHQNRAYFPGCKQASLCSWTSHHLLVSEIQARLVIVSNSMVTCLDQRNQSYCPLYCFRWRRVFLHTHTAQAAKFASSRYVSSLRSDFRWLVTSMLKPSKEMVISSSLNQQELKRPEWCVGCGWSSDSEGQTRIPFQTDAALA